MNVSNPGRERGIVEQDGWQPVVPFRAIAAFRKPHAARLDAQAMVAGVNAGGHLRGKGLIVQNQRHVGVGGVAGQDLDVAISEPAGKFRGNIALNSLEMGKAILIPLVPLAGEIGEMRLAGLFELLLVGGGAGGALVKICRKSGLETVVGELLKEDGGQTDSYGWPGLEEGTFADHVQNGQIGFRRRLVKPGLSVGI